MVRQIGYQYLTLGDELNYGKTIIKLELSSKFLAMSVMDVKDQGILEI